MMVFGADSGFIPYAVSCPHQLCSFLVRQLVGFACDFRSGFPVDAFCQTVGNVAFVGCLFEWK